MEDSITAFMPTCLRPRTNRTERELAYAICEEYEPYKLHMWKGPHASDWKMLETLGKSDKSCIICLKPDWTEIILWRWLKDRWVRAAKNYDPSLVLLCPACQRESLILGHPTCAKCMDWK